jgi:2-dehydro-3-deoxygluconokinase
MPRVITFGEIMMRLCPQNHGRFVQASSYNALYAGSEANVAASLAHLGISSEHVTCFPVNDLAMAATSQLRQHGVGVDHIVYREGRIGVYFIEHGASVRSPKIIYDRYDSAFAKMKSDDFNWDDILHQAEWFHWSGITPAISQSAADACTAAITTAKKKGLKISGDINYRRNLWQYGKSARDIMPDMIEMCDLLVAGNTDLENCLGIVEGTLEGACEKTAKMYPNIKKVATTNRRTIDTSHQTLRGVLWNGKGILQSREYDLNPIIDRVGSGDAFMAGLVYGFLNNLPDQQVLDFATAACALKHTVEGDVNVCSVNEIETLVKEENVGKLLR